MKWLKKKIEKNKIWLKRCISFCMIFVCLFMCGCMDESEDESINSSYTSSDACVDGMVYDNPKAPLYTVRSTWSKDQVKRAKMIRDYVRPLLREEGLEQYIDIVVSISQEESGMGTANTTNWMGYLGEHEYGIGSLKGGVGCFVRQVRAVEKAKMTQIEPILIAYNSGPQYLDWIKTKFNGVDSPASRANYPKFDKMDYPERVMARVIGQRPEEAGYGTTASSSQQRTKLIEFVRQQIGKNYVYGTAGPNTFDCSGLVYYCYQKALGMQLARSSSEQYKTCKKIKQSEAQMGDLVFFSQTKSKDNITHVGIYIKKDTMIEAPSKGKQVREFSISKHGNCVGYGRFLSDANSMSDVPLYDMHDPKWSSLSWGGPHFNTIGASGCGPTSLAMIISYWTGKKYTPADVVKWTQKKGNGGYHQTGGIDHAMFAAICSDFNIQCKYIGWDSVVKELKKGHIVLCSADAGIFTTDGHMMVLAGITSDGKIMVNDPNGNNYTKDNLADGFKNGFSQNTIKSQMKGYWTTYK